MQRRKALFGLILATQLLTPLAYASDVHIPKNIRIVVPATPGSSTDVFARTMASMISEGLNTAVMVENKPGASGMIGTTYVAKGPKDGSLILIHSSSLLTSGATMKDPPIDVINDLIPLAIIEKNPLVVAVSTKSGIESPAELLSIARANPGKITHGTFGTGTIAHIAEEKLASMADIKFTNVPYKGTSQAVNDMAAGTIDMVIATYASVAPAVNAGRAKIIAITSEKENASFPNIPTVASVVPGYDVELLLGLFAPAGTPKPVITSLNNMFNDVSNSAKIREMMVRDGGVPILLNPEQIKSMVDTDYASFKTLANQKGIVSQ